MLRRQWRLVRSLWCPRGVRVQQLVENTRLSEEVVRLAHQMQSGRRNRREPGKLAGELAHSPLPGVETVPGCGQNSRVQPRYHSSALRAAPEQPPDGPIVAAHRRTVALRWGDHLPGRLDFTSEKLGLSQNEFSASSRLRERDVDAARPARELRRLLECVRMALCRWRRVQKRTPSAQRGIVYHLP